MKTEPDLCKDEEPAPSKTSDRHSRKRLVYRSDILLAPDSSKVVIQPFHEGNMETRQTLVRHLVDLPEEEAQLVLEQINSHFDGRHPNLPGLLQERFRVVAEDMKLDAESLSESRRLLIGGYFLSEYSLESAALFNPSIVPHPNQSGVPRSCLRVIVSLRATGEGHISSIEFRTGVVDSKGNLVIDPAVDCVTAPLRRRNPAYKKRIFRRRLEELSVTNKIVDEVLNQLEPTFSHDELERALRKCADDNKDHCVSEVEALKQLRFLAECNYVVQFPTSTPLSQHVIFPQSPSERQGIEDARFVKFEDPELGSTYFATYTAYNGHMTLPQLIETEDFSLFRLSTLSGKIATNKGMAIFPRKINGRFATLARSDGINHYLAYSDDIYHWEEATLLARPKYPWELVKVGNCGSPLETEHGWLVITHGVGAMRRYCMGAMLLDLEDPGKVIGRLKHPLLEPNENERVGYVPNVVYSCGSLIHKNWIVIPYAMSDYAVTAARVRVDDLVEVLKNGG